MVGECFSAPRRTESNVSLGPMAKRSEEWHSGIRMRLPICSVSPGNTLRSSRRRCRKHKDGFAQCRLEHGDARHRDAAAALPTSGAGSKRHQARHQGRVACEWPRNAPAEVFDRTEPGFQRPVPPIADLGTSGRPHRSHRQLPSTSATCPSRGRPRVRAPALAPEPRGLALARPGLPVQGPDRFQACVPSRGCRGTRSRPGGPSDVDRR